MLSHWRSRAFSSGRPIAVPPYAAGRNADGRALGTPGIISMNAGQVLVHRPQPVGEPRPQVRPASRPAPVKIMFLAVK